MTFRLKLFLFVSVLLPVLILGCGSSVGDKQIESFDSNTMNALSITDEEYKKKFIDRLNKSAIDYSEMRILDNSLYVVTWKSDEKKVDEIYKYVVGVRPSQFSFSPMSSTALNQIKVLFDVNNIDFEEGHFYGASYIEWSPSDDKFARSLIESYMKIDRE